MAYRVRTTTKAKRDLDAIITRLLSQEAGEAGLRWFQGLREAVASLVRSPQRCALAPENGRFPFEVRHLLCGRKPQAHSGGLTEGRRYAGRRNRATHPPRSVRFSSARVPLCAAPRRAAPGG